MKTPSFGSLAVAASAAALPMAGTAQAADMPNKAVAAPIWVPQWQFSAEGGLAISNYSRTAFPGGLDPAFNDKLGTCDTTCVVNSDNVSRSGSLVPPRNIGWSGALSIGRDIDPVWDWRLSGSFTQFATNRRSAAVNRVLSTTDTSTGDGPLFETRSFVNSSRLATESDRFSFATVDFDLGRKWQQGLLQTRVFAGFRAMGTNETFNISNSEAKGLISTEAGSIGTSLFTGQSNQLTQTNGRSHFAGIGPRIGVEGFYGTTVGVVGSASAAFLGGWRYSTFNQTQTSSASASECYIGIVGTGCVGPFTFNHAAANTLHRSTFAGVGDFAASLGVAWRPTAVASVEVGYRVEYLLNVRESFGFANASALTGHGQFDQKKDVLINAPYVKGIIRF